MKLADARMIKDQIIAKITDGSVKTSDRSIDVATRVLNGETCVSVGKSYGISRGRTWQLVHIVIWRNGFRA